MVIALCHLTEEKEHIDCALGRVIHNLGILGDGQ